MPVLLRARVIKLFFNIRSYDSGNSNDVNDQFDIGTLELTDTWKTYSYTITPTLDSNGLNPDFYFRMSSRIGGDGLQDNTIHLDNISLVPEPSATAAFLGLTSFALILRRRR